MKRLITTILTASLVLSIGFLFTPNSYAKATNGSWTGTLVDKMCGSMFEKKNDAAQLQSHDKACIMKCCKGGKNLGMMVDGKWYAFDAKGNKLAWKLLKNTKEDSNIQVKVDGKLNGNKIAVKSITQA